MRTYHDAETQAQRARKEDVAVLDTEIGLARNEAHQNINADDGRAKDASFRVRVSDYPEGGINEWLQLTHAAHAA